VAGCQARLITSIPQDEPVFAGVAVNEHFILTCVGTQARYNLYEWSPDTNRYECLRFTGYFKKQVHKNLPPTTKVQRYGCDFLA
jgi:hypothetical protein